MMKNLKTVVALTSALIILFAGVCPADTFTNRQTNETLHGYITSRLPGSAQSARQDDSSPESRRN